MKAVLGRTFVYGIGMVAPATLYLLDWTVVERVSFAAPVMFNGLKPRETVNSGVAF
jgi:hypothetical protein